MFFGIEWGWWILIIYLIGCLISTVPIMRWFIRKEDAEIFEGIAMALCLCWLWPLVIPGAWLYQIAKMDESEKR